MPTGKRRDESDYRIRGFDPNSSDGLPRPKKRKNTEIRFYEDGSSTTSSKKGVPLGVVDPAYNVQGPGQGPRTHR